MAKDHIKDVYLDQQAIADYYEYGTSTIEDRAIVGPDGLKPVMRRALWAVHNLHAHHTANTIKGALMVGETMGKYHPHGDQSIYQAMAAATLLPQPLFDGTQTNWGTMTTNAAAMRYTEGRLTKYSDLIFFDKFYMPVMEFVSNYDSTRLEPVNLINLLPNGMLNGNFGICPGVNTRTPAFTLKSLIAVLKEVLANKGKCDAKMCESLEWISDFGGRLDKSSYNKTALKEFYKTGVASLDWRSTYTLDEKANAIRYTRFAPFSTNDNAKPGEKSPIEKLLAAVEAVSGVASIDDDSDKKDPYRQAYIVRFVKTLKGHRRDKAIKQVDKLFTRRQRYDVKLTDRVLDVQGDKVKISLRPLSVPTIITEWVAYRIKLEQDACAYWIKKTKEEIRWHEVMRLAVAKLDFIIKCVKNEKLDDAQLVKAIAKGLKITEVEADLILKRNLRQLRKLEEKALVAKIKELETTKKELEGRHKHPAKYVTTHLDKLVKELA